MDPAPLSKPAFDACYADIARSARRWAARFGAGRDLDDVTQEVLLAISRDWGDYDPARGPVEPWVKEYARRITRRTRGLAFNRKREGGETDLEERAHEDRSPEERAQQDERYALLLELLTPIEEDRRIIFELKELDGFAMSEIAEMLQVNVNTAYSRLRKAWEEVEQRFERRRLTAGGEALLGVLAFPDLLGAARAPGSDAPGDLAGPADASPADAARPGAGAVPGTVARGLAGVAARGAAAKAVSVAAMAFLIGAGVGAVGHARMGGTVAAPEVSLARPVTPPPVVIDPPVVPTAAPAPPAAGSEAPRLPSAPTRPPLTPGDGARPLPGAAPPAPTAPLASTAPLAEEVPAPDRLLIEKARIALGNGDLAVARDALQRHLREFPDSKWAPRRQQLLEQLRRREAGGAP
jgi:RNA polymerase sigma-70 factor (ECF subfamily)